MPHGELGLGMAPPLDQRYREAMVIPDPGVDVAGDCGEAQRFLVHYHRALVRAMSSALVNRVTVLNLRVDADEWQDWARKNGIRADIRSYVSFMPDALMREVADLYERAGLLRIDARFAEHLREADTALHGRLMAARAAPDALDRKAEADIWPSM